MSAKPQHNGLSADDRSKIRSAILSSREILESEFERQLERYGVYDDERVPLSKLGHLSLQDRETRREIDAALERELEATEDYQRAYRNYVREATKEYLNRYVGLKTIEARGLVTETLTSKAEYGNRSYLHYTVDEIAGELTDAPDDGLGVALDLAFQEIGAEIRILFEDTDYTAIEPEFTVRRDVFEELDELDDDAWAADEAIGWVYQYFGEKEREEIDERIQDHNYKVQDTDIATKTQLFTPRYIVEYLVDNSLGRLWLEMYGDDTAIDNEENCFYLTPVEESLTDRKQKDPREITVLDPACGGGHFLFYAFDVLYEMYQDRTDVVESQIPREILKNNLYGIDIDPGAVQLAALALYLKAKTIEPDVTIEQLNIVSADAVLINGERKEQVLDEVELDIEERLIEQIWTSFEHVREWGSLVNVNERVEELIEEEREEFEQLQQQGQARLGPDGEMITQSSFITEKQGEISWEELKDRLIDDAREIANKALEQNSVIDELFAGEVEKSVELLDVLLKEYDVVVANPPYLQSGKMGNTLKEFVSSNYRGKRDLYASFIERNLQFCVDDGYVGMVTPENFMFTYSFRGLRKQLLNQAEFVEGAHLSGYSFPPKDRPFTIPFIMRNREPDENSLSRFYRLTHEQEEYDSLEKTINGLHSVTKSIRSKGDHSDVYKINQLAFLDIGRQPFLYWFGQDILNLFTKYPNLDDIGVVRQGLATGDDPRFVRKWWEVTERTLENKFVKYQKSGGKEPFYDYPDDYLFWENNGEAIREFEGGNGTPNEEYYFTPGITYRSFGNYLVAREFSDEMIFAQTALYVGSDEIEPKCINGLLNSILYRFIANGINPSLHFEAGDGKRYPIKTDIESEDEIITLVDKGIAARKELSKLREDSSDYDPIAFSGRIENDVLNLLKTEDIYQSHVEIIQGAIDDVVLEEYDLTNQSDKLYKNLPSNLKDHPHRFTNDDFEPIVDIPSGENANVNTYAQKIESIGSDSLRELADSTNLSPYSIAVLRYQEDLYSSDEEKSAAGRALSYYLGCAMGRWQSTNLAEPVDDGILVFESDSGNDLKSIIRRQLDNHSQSIPQIESQLQSLLNKSPYDWLKENFFRYHHNKEYRRRGQRIPVYWQLESNGGSFSSYIYYHSLSSDTLPKLRGQHVDARIQTLNNRINNIESELEGAEGEHERELRSELEELQEQLDDVEDFGERLDALIDDGFEPDFEAGIWENIQKVDEYDLLQTELDKL